MKKMIIIGAGIAGLTTGIYGRLNGFDTEIYEMHNIPGGECTGWKRKEYYFDGCIHWLLGSKTGTSLNKIWREVGALNDSVAIINHDIFYSVLQDGNRVNLYRDITKLEAHLIEISPQDSELIKELCKSIKAMKSMTIPTEKPFDKMNVIDIAKMALTMIPLMKHLSKYEKITIEELAEQFKSPLLKRAFSSLIPVNYKATALVVTLASLADGDGGWPTGGSLAMAKRMEEKYLALGGKIFYKSRVDKIIVENGIAKGILLTNGNKFFGDYIISTADGYTTIFNMLEGKFVDDNLKLFYTDRENYPLYTSMQVSLGIDTDLSHYPHTQFIECNKAIDSGGKNNNYIGIKHFCYDNTLIPKGKTAITVILHADYDWWKNKYSNKELYQQEKKRIADEVIPVVNEHYPETIGKIDVVDIATPMTYVKYCNAWRGSYMSFITTPTGKFRYMPGNLPEVQNFYLSGQWTMPPGGLPTAVLTGRWVIQRICGIEKRKFQS